MSFVFCCIDIKIKVIKWLHHSNVVGERDGEKKLLNNINKAGYTATEVACGWAGAVMNHADSSIWAGAVMQKTPENAENVKKANSD